MFKIIIVLLFSTILMSDMLSDIVQRTKKIQKEQQIKNVKKTMLHTSQASQKEYKKLQEMISKEHEYSNTVIYFTSQSLSGNHQISITEEIARLNKQGLDAKVAPITRGLDRGVFKYAESLHDELKKYPPMQREALKRATKKLKINPQLFKDFNVSRVPTMVLASCQGDKISKENCSFYYKVTGKVSLLKIGEITNISISKLFEEGSDE